MGIEVAQTDLKLMESSDQLTIEENDALLRLSVEFLRNFGVHLNRTEL